MGTLQHALGGTEGGEEVQLYSLSTKALYEGGRLTIRPGNFTPGKETCY